MFMSEKAGEPCRICPYKLGIVKTFVDPCPQCRKNGYSFFKRLNGEEYEAEEGSPEKDGRK